MKPRTRISNQSATKLLAERDNRARAWRHAARDAELAYRRWRQGAVDERDLAAASYRAALEREEKAAHEYGRAAEAALGRPNRCRALEVRLTKM